MKPTVPCIACGRELVNVFDESENQPEEGLSFETPGHYGSTTFDPMDGSHIEINVCDPCITEAKKMGRVLWGRRKKPVLYQGSFQVPMLVGWCSTPGRPLMKWTDDFEPGSPYDEESNDRLIVDGPELGDPEGILPEIDWIPQAVEAAKEEYEKEVAGDGSSDQG